MKNNLERLKSIKAVPVQEVELVEVKKMSENHNFPILVQSNVSGLNLEKWINNNKDFYNDTLKLNGALLFRNFNINTVDDFSAFISTLGIKAQSYTNRTSPRYSVAENVYTSTTQPKTEIINFHSENSYSQTPPNNLIFCCIIPSKVGGETPLADNRLILKSIPNSIVDKFRKLGVLYKRRVSEELGLGWREIFQVDTKEEVEEQCRQNDIQFNWNDETLDLNWKGPAIVKHYLTGEEIWFNHAFFFNKYSYSEDFISILDSDDDLPFSTFYGDGSLISEEEYNHIKNAYNLSRVEFTWQKGDLLIIDNYFISHARNSYEGDRQILVSIF